MTDERIWDVLIALNERGPSAPKKLSSLLLRRDAAAVIHQLLADRARLERDIAGLESNIDALLHDPDEQDEDSDVDPAEDALAFIDRVTLQWH